MIGAFLITYKVNMAMKHAMKEMCREHLYTYSFVE